MCAMYSVSVRLHVFVIMDICSPGAVLNRIHHRLSVLEPYVRELYQAIVCQPCTLPMLSEAWSTFVPLSVSNKRPLPAVCPILVRILWCVHDPVGMVVEWVGF